jgi:hypothetical protein
MVAGSGGSSSRIVRGCCRSLRRGHGGSCVLWLDSSPVLGRVHFRRSGAGFKGRSVGLQPTGLFRGSPGRPGGRRFSPASPPGPGRCGHCRAVMSRRDRQTLPAPAINPRYLSDPTDRRAMIGGLRFVRRLFAAPALARYCGAEIRPGAAVAAPTNCSTIRGRRARRSITRPAPERRAAAGWGWSTTSCARTARVPQGRRRLGDADGHLDQHQRADDHDRGEVRRYD